MSSLLGDYLTSPGSWLPDQKPRGSRIELVNWYVFGASVALFVVLVPAALVWHYVQARRNADVLLVHAGRCEQEARWKEAANLCYRYLKLRPDDPRGWVRLCRAMDQAADSRLEKTRAVELYFQTIALAQDDNELRRRLAELLCELERYAVAEYQAEQLLKRAPDDPGGWRIKARASYALAHALGRIPIEKVAAAYRKAIEFNPGDVELSVTLADLYRRELVARSATERQTLADAVMHRLVASNTAPAWLARYQYRRRYALPDADADLDRAWELGKDHPEVQLAVGDRAVSRRAFDEAFVQFRAVTNQLPTDRRGYLGLGKALLAASRRDEAIAAWNEGLAQVGLQDLPLNFRLADLLIVLGRLSEAQQVLDRLDAAVQAHVNELAPRNRQALRDTVDFVRAKWFSAQGDFNSAIPVLERVRTTRAISAETPEEGAGLIEITYQLAACYSARREPDRAAQVYASAIDLEPNNPTHYLAAGEAWEAAGQLDAAIRAYQQGLVYDEAPAAGWVLLARALLTRERELPESQRNWDAFEQALEQAHQRGVKSTLLRLIEADHLAAQGKFTEALNGLESAQSGADAERLWQSLVMGYEKWGQPEQADRAIEDYEAKFGKSIGTALLRAAVLTHRRQHDQALELLTAALPSAPPDRRPAVEFQLAQLELRSGREADARARLERLREQHPENAPLAELLAELALDTADADELALCEDRLHALAGVAGVEWRYYRGRRLLLDESAIDANRLAEIETLSLEISQLRPEWGKGHLLAALVAERQGHVADATLELENALRMGEENLLVYQRLVRLLYAQNRIAEADRYLSRLMDLTSYVPQLSAMAISVSVGQGQFDRAVQLAEEGARLRPDDPFSQVWWGQALMLAGQVAEAEPHFRQAIQLAPGKLEPWLALLGFYLRTEQFDAARNNLPAFTAAVELPPADQAFLFGQVHELARDTDQAAKLYRQALVERPDDLAVLQRTAAFFLERDPEYAQALLRHLLSRSPDAATARGTLALMLAEHGGQENWQEAFALLSDAAERPHTRSAVELRTLARLRIEHGGLENQREAIRLLEELLHSDRESTAADRLLLARLYEVEKRIPQARRELTTLATAGTPQADNLLALVDFLLRNDSVSDATSWLVQLRELAPDSFRVLELRARWLKLQDRTAEIADEVEPFLETRLAKLSNDRQRAPAMLAAAEIYALVDLPDAAERWYRHNLQIDPQGHLPLIRWLGRCQRLDEAVALARERAAADTGPDTALALAAALVLGGTNAEQAAAAEELFTQALERLPDHAALRLAIGNLYYVLGRHDDAVRMYREALARDGRSINAMNNLALLLSEQEEHRAEARQLVERAIAAAGKQFELVDTLSVLLIRDGRASEAVFLLKDLLTQSVAGPMQHFHLAMAYHEQGATNDARASLDEAQARGLERECLTPSERDLLAYLQKSLHDGAPR